MSSKEWGEIEWEGEASELGPAHIGRYVWLRLKYFDRMGGRVRFQVPGETPGWVPAETIVRIEAEPRTYTEDEVREVLSEYLMNEDGIRDVLHALREAKR